MRIAAACLTGVLLIAAPASAQDTPACEISTDPAYGTTKASPIKIGGGATTVSARERRYLDALRGPGGEALTYKRTGSQQGPDQTILDHYVISWRGLDTPKELYLDAYRWEVPRAPLGFRCETPFGLTRPPADPFAIQRKTTAMAIRWGHDHEVAGVPLSATEAYRYGAAWDAFRLAALASRAATASGAPLDPDDPPARVGSQPLLLVAYPLTCGERVVKPKAIAVQDAAGREAPKGELLKDQALASALPGVEVQEGAIGQQMRINLPRNNDRVVIEYDAAVCEGSAKDVTLPVRLVAARPARMVPLMLPEGGEAPPADNPLRLTVVVSPDGTPQVIDYAAGPDALLDAARLVAASWQIQPNTWNGVPVIVPLTIPVRVVEPGTMSAPGVSPTGGAPDPFGSLSTINVIRTPDVPSLPSPLCPVSSDNAFGRSEAAAIPVGGGTERIVERARMYLVALRDPKGRGLSIRRHGVGASPPASAIEAFDVTINGETTPTRFYFDATRWSDVVAPAGFVCTGPMMLRPPGL